MDPDGLNIVSWVYGLRLVHPVAEAAPPASAAYPLDATEQEITDGGNTGRLTMSNGYQTGEHTIPGVGGPEAWSAAPTGFFEASCATLDFTAGTGVKVFELVPSPTAAYDNSDAGTASWASGIAVFDETTATGILEVNTYAMQDGSFLTQVFANDYLTDLPTATAPGVIGFEMDTDTSTYRVLFDGVPQTLDAYEFSPNLVTIVMNLSIFDSRLAGDEGAVVSMTLRTEAADMTGTGYVAGATDAAGDPV